MHVIVSPLPEPITSHVASLWELLRVECGLEGVLQTPLPHITWWVDEAASPERVVVSLNAWAARITPLDLRTSGIGIFSGSSPVIYLPVVKTFQLAEAHQVLWDLHPPAGMDGIQALYSPGRWVPHITLAFGDVQPESLVCALQHLAGEPFDWTFQVREVLYAFQTPDQQWMEYHHLEFSGEPL